MAGLVMFAGAAILFPIPDVLRAYRSYFVPSSGVTLASIRHLLLEHDAVLLLGLAAVLADHRLSVFIEHGHGRLFEGVSQIGHTSAMC